MCGYLLPKIYQYRKIANFSLKVSVIFKVKDGTLYDLLPVEVDFYTFPDGNPNVDSKNIEVCLEWFNDYETIILDDFNAKDFHNHPNLKPNILIPDYSKLLRPSARTEKLCKEYNRQISGSIHSDNLINY